MTFTSYAQNFEDIMLWRALKHIRNGRYIDVGAQHPIIDSVSKGFYENGWKGVHVEPVAEYAAMLRRDRPDETVLQLAVGEFDGLIEFNVIPTTGLSTVVTEYAEMHKAVNQFEIKKTFVPILTLKTALSPFNDSDIHWLKIDVEGCEESVLKGWDSTLLRPWIMVIEATIPGSSQTDFAKWDPIVVNAGYDFVYFDGLNRFYVDQTHPELVDAFRVPPNVFDGVQLGGYATSAFGQRINNASSRNEPSSSQELFIADLFVRRQTEEANQKIIQLEADAKLRETELRSLISTNADLLHEVNANLSFRESAQADLRQANNALKRACDDNAEISAKFQQVSNLLVEAERDQQVSSAEIKRGERLITALEDRLKSSRVREEILGQRVNDLSHQVAALYSSNSWKATAVVRSLSTLIRRLTRQFQTNSASKNSSTNLVEKEQTLNTSVNTRKGQRLSNLTTSSPIDLLPDDPTNCSKTEAAKFKTAQFDTNSATVIGSPFLNSNKTASDYTGSMMSSRTAKVLAKLLKS